ncbi:hypothetical protein LX32DRAFT_634803 [Colletotrichum zoysiae]|uniref:Uncharacterized protein n=1 Tax=Colletotrichum zoysiae TaxID=1216348 RepID=A0AAD9M589_9PEZI|nr:hypothetical protein LX32DRAFT_634803 [Colletotrichum zoysiae]
MGFFFFLFADASDWRRFAEIDTLMISTQAKLLTFFSPAGSAIVGFEKGEESDDCPLLYLCRYVLGRAGVRVVCWDCESLGKGGRGFSLRARPGRPACWPAPGVTVAGGGMTKLRCRDGPAKLGRRAAPECGLRDAVGFASSQSRTLPRWFIWRRLVSPPPRRHGMDPPRITGTGFCGVRK